MGLRTKLIITYFVVLVVPILALELLQYQLFSFTLPDRIILAPYVHYHSLFIFTGLLIIVAGITGILVIAKTIIKPLEDIIQSAQIVGSGNLDHRIRQYRKDEIGKLARTFDDMTENLQKLTSTSINNENELRQLNAELEKRVKERTAELSQAIMELQHINESMRNEMEQRKRAETEAKQALETEKELNELKSRFVSMASHEFRTPLGGIMTSASLISRYNAVSDGDKRKRHVDTIKASVHSLTNILNDFLSIDKLEEGKFKCNPTSFDLDYFAKNLIEEMESQTKNGQHIIYKHHGQSTSVRIDPDMLRNIMLNLLSNAVKYSPENKDIIFTTHSDTNKIGITVKDFGIGIPPADQKHLFERFFRASNALTIQGTGLGLNIIKKYLEIMDGTIDYISEENHGTVFNITLPRELLYEENTTH